MVNKRLIYGLMVFCLSLVLYNSPLFTNDENSLYVVKKDLVYDSIEAKGELKSSSSIFVGCPQIRRVWNFTITYMAPEGKPVKKGQKIISFDTKKLYEQLTLKTSEYKTAQKELEKARLVEQEALDSLMLSYSECNVKTAKAKRKAQQPEEFVALNELKKLKLDYQATVLEEKLGKSKIDNQKARMKSKFSLLNSKLKRLEGKIKELKLAIKSMVVKAPKGGMLVYVANWKGKKRVVGDSVWRGDFIMEIPDLNQMNMEAVIPEAASGKIENNLKAKVKIDANPDTIYEGKIVSVGRIFRRKSKDQPDIVLDCKIELKDPDPNFMKPGMAASVEVLLPGNSEALHVPKEAVIKEKGENFVLKKGFWGTSKKIKVVAGKSFKSMVEIKSGIKESDVLIIPSLKNI